MQVLESTVDSPQWQQVMMREEMQHKVGQGFTPSQIQLRNMLKFTSSVIPWYGSGVWQLDVDVLSYGYGPRWKNKNGPTRKCTMVLKMTIYLYKGRSSFQWDALKNK